MAPSTEPDWYEVLGVDPGATDAEIGRAFRSLARRFHPDAGPDASGNRFSDVARAYEVLGDPSRRADYDRVRRGGPVGGIRIPVRRWAAGASEPASVDTAPRSGPEREPPEEVEVAVSVAESLTGAVVRVTLPEAAVCPDCAGTGHRSRGPCPECGGGGRRRRLSGSITINQMCSACGGSGSPPPQVCGACSGRGWTQAGRELTVRVPAGVADGTRLRLRSASGQTPGLARVRIRPDPWYSRDGPDLVLRLPVSVTEAVLGTVVEAHLPDGDADIAVPAGSRPGDRLRIPGRGVPGGECGDLVAVVEVVLPEEPTEAERAALEALGAYGADPRKDWPARNDPAPPD